MGTRTVPVTHGTCPLRPSYNPADQISFSEIKVANKGYSFSTESPKPLYLLIGHMKHVFYDKDSAIPLTQNGERERRLWPDHQ